MRITTVLGDAREATRTYPDGSVDCPWCGSAIVFPSTECRNPWCDGYPGWTPGALMERRRLVQEEKAWLEREARNREWSAKYARERRDAHETWIAETYAEARRRGACVPCCFAPGWERSKYVVHRGLCPKERAAQAAGGKA